MRIKSYRLSCIWVDASPELLSGAATGPFRDLLDSDIYAGRFTKLLDGSPDPLVRLPWAPNAPGVLPKKNHYWDDMILKGLPNKGKPGRGACAWDKALPLLHAPKIFDPGLVQRSFVEGWYFPLGVSLSLTAWVSGDFDGGQLKQSISTLVGARVAITWPDGTKTTETIDDAAGEAMNRLRTAGFGLDPAQSTPEHTRILTIISAEHDPAEKDKPAAESAMLADVKVACGASPNATWTQGREIYASPGRRVIWRPDRMLPQPQGVHTLGCLHRNIKMATLHVGSLIRAAEVIVDNFKATGRVAEPAIDYAKNIAGLLGRIYGAKKGGNKDALYVQPCLTEQIAEFEESVSELRTRLGMPALK